jgi:hypothetical protein
MGCLALYEPINALKPVADGVWIVDGPQIKMTYPWMPVLSVPFTTRMSLIRLPDGGIWVHSPTEPTEDLVQAVEALGPVRALVAPNALHYWWIPDWKARFPDARTYAAPDMGKRVHRRINRFDVVLGHAAPAEWGGVLDQIMVSGDFMTEAAFFHLPSRTAILTDLIENFEPDKITCLWLRLACRWSGCSDPDGKMPVDLRATFRRNHEAVGAAAQRMIDWNPERVILAHGRWYPKNGAAELRRAFRWCLPEAA